MATSTLSPEKKRELLKLIRRSAHPAHAPTTPEGEKALADAIEAVRGMEDEQGDDALDE
jgi:hypothetical protein